MPAGWQRIARPVRGMRERHRRQFFVLPSMRIAVDDTRTVVRRMFAARTGVRVGIRSFRLRSSDRLAADAIQIQRESRGRPSVGAVVVGCISIQSIQFAGRDHSSSSASFAAARAWFQSSAGICTAIVDRARNSGAPGFACANARDICAVRSGCRCASTQSPRRIRDDECGGVSIAYRIGRRRDDDGHHGSRMRERAAQSRCFPRRCVGDRASAEVIRLISAHRAISVHRTRRCRPKSSIRPNCCCEMRRNTHRALARA